MARIRERLPVPQAKVVTEAGTYTEQQRRFLLALEKVCRVQLPRQDALAPTATLSELITEYNTLIANLKEIGAMEK